MKATGILLTKKARLIAPFLVSVMLNETAEFNDEPAIDYMYIVMGPICGMFNLLVAYIGHTIYLKERDSIHLFISSMSIGDAITTSKLPVTFP